MLLTLNIDIMDIYEITYEALTLMIISFVLGFAIAVAFVLYALREPTPKCSHKNQILRTIYSSINCETTALFCQDCYKQISTAKTECL